MCQASNEDGSSPSGPLRRFASHERLAEWRSQAGSYLKGNRSGSPKVMQDKGIQAEVQAPPRFLFSAIMVLACCVALNQVGLFVPLVMITRNCSPILTFIVEAVFQEAMPMTPPDITSTKLLLSSLDPSPS